MDKTKTRIYLSGAITGIEDYKKDFYAIEEKLIDMGYKKIVNPSNLDKVLVNGEYEEYMKVCLKLIDECDIVVMIPGWNKSAGANREMGYALGQGKQLIDWDEDIEKVWKI